MENEREEWVNFEELYKDKDDFISESLKEVFKGHKAKREKNGDIRVKLQKTDA